VGSLLLALPLGLAIGFVLGAVGGGGAVLALPVLIYVLGQDVHSATTASLVVVGASSLVGAVKLGRAGHVCWEVAGVYAAGAAGGTLLGTAANEVVDGRVLILLFVPVLLGAAYATWRKAGRHEASTPASVDGCPPLRPAWTGSLGFGVGLLIGFFGVGGGFVIVPTLAFVLHMAMRRAVATSLLVVFLVSTVAFTAHLAAGSLPAWPLTLALTAAASAGALGGATMSERLPQDVLARAFAALVTCVALYLLLDVLVLGGAVAG